MTLTRPALLPDFPLLSYWAAKLNLSGKATYQDLTRWSVDNFRFGDKSPGTARKLFKGRALTVLEIGALSDLDDVAVWIADVAANLAVLGNRFC